MERMNVRRDGFVGGNETFQFHTEGGGLNSSDVEMTSERVIEVGSQSPNVNPVSAAVTAFTVGAIAACEDRNAIILHVAEVVKKLRGERMSWGGGDAFIAHPVPGWDCI
jgi:hypothetical protein